VKKICYNSEDIQFFLGDCFLLAHPVHGVTAMDHRDTSVARHSPYVLKVPLNTNQTKLWTITNAMMCVTRWLLYPPLTLSDAFVWRLSVAYIGPKSRTERPRKTKLGTEVAHVTLDSDTTFKVKGHQAALLAAVLARQTAPAVGVGTCWPWETAATLSAGRRKTVRRPQREERGGGIP